MLSRRTPISTRPNGRNGPPSRRRAHDHTGRPLRNCRPGPGEARGWWPAPPPPSPRADGVGGWVRPLSAGPSRMCCCGGGEIQDSGCPLWLWVRDVRARAVWSHEPQRRYRVHETSGATVDPPVGQRVCPAPHRPWLQSPLHTGCAQRRGPRRRGGGASHREAHPHTVRNMHAERRFPNWTAKKKRRKPRWIVSSHLLVRKSLYPPPPLERRHWDP